MKKLILGFAMFAALGISSSNALADKSVNLGMLVCDMSKGVGLILVEKRKMTCEFRPVSGPSESYQGKITDVGIELGEIKEWGFLQRL